MKTSDIPEAPILEYLAERQGKWTSYWEGYFEGKENDEHPPGSGRLIGHVADVHYALPPGTPRKLALSKLKSMAAKGLIGGCACGCRGDFEITDWGLAAIGRTRTKLYTGYGELEGSVITTGPKSKS
jgi:hypothetical protein